MSEHWVKITDTVQVKNARANDDEDQPKTFALNRGTQLMAIGEDVVDYCLPNVKPLPRMLREEFDRLVEEGKAEIVKKL